MLSSITVSQDRLDLYVFHDGKFICEREAMPIGLYRKTMFQVGMQSGSVYLHCVEAKKVTVLGVQNKTVKGGFSLFYFGRYLIRNKLL